MAEKGTVQSLDRAFDIMEQLCGARDGLPIHELTERTGLHKSTVHRMLSSMAARGYVRKDEESGRYRMTTKLYALSGQVVENPDLVQIARAPMEALSRQVHETVHLVVPEAPTSYTCTRWTSNRALSACSRASACAVPCTARA